MTDRPPLPFAARALLGGTVVEAFGSGLTFPFLLVYLHQVRGIPLSTTGLLLAIPGLVGFVAGPVSGTLTDRFGPRTSILAALSCSAGGSLLVAFVHAPPLAVPALVLLGGGQGTFFAAQNALFSRIVDGPSRQRLFANHFALLNAGFGGGSLLGGVVADVHRPATFVVIYLLDAASYAVYSAVLLAVRLRPVAEHADAQATTGSYAEVVRHPLFPFIAGLALLMALAGYGAISSGLPAFATVTLVLPPRAVAVALVANTALIVAGQLLVLRYVERMRRTRAVCVVAGLWGGAWLLLGVAGVVGPHAARWGLVVVFGAVFGIGETFMAPTIAPMTGAVAPPHLQGRFFALTSLSYSIAFTVSPPLVTALVAHHLGGVWIALMVAGCGAFALLARRLERRLTPEQNGALALPDPEAAALSAGV